MAFDFQCSDSINPATRVNFKSLVQTILDHAPSDATGEAFLQKTEEGPYRASIQIHCQDVEITCRKSCDSPQVLMHSLKNDLFEQIRDWRANRDFDAMAVVM